MRVHFEEAGAPQKIARLERAILLYCEGSHYAATLNPIRGDGNGKPRIGAGTPLSKADFLRIVEDLSDVKKDGATPRLLPENLLFASAELMLWHRPAQRRRIYFQTNDKAFNAEVNGREVLHPALLFKAKPGRLFVYALKSDARPTLETPLFRAPYFNVYEMGALCEGSYRLPDACVAGEFDAWEKGFFETHFSHTNINQNAITSHAHGHNGLWRAMASPRRRLFDCGALVPLKRGQKTMTVAEVLHGK